MCMCKHDWQLVDLSEFVLDEAKRTEKAVKVPIRIKYCIFCKKCGKIHKKASKIVTNIAIKNFQEKHYE